MQKKPQTINERMMYSTVRIEGALATGDETAGTGFFLGYQTAAGTKIRMLVSNRHVVEGMVHGTLHLHRPRTTSDGGLVLAAGSAALDMGDFEPRWIPHPNPAVDLCALPYEVIHAAVKATDQEVFATVFESVQVIPPDEELASVDAAEEVQMVGYPEGLWDRLNHYPVFRRGTIATHPRIDYRGRPEILIDLAAHNGCSGSPVVILNRTNFKEEEKGLWPVILLGVLSSGLGIGVDGTMIDVPLHRKKGTTPMTTHLSAIVKSRELLVLAVAVAAKTGPPVEVA